MLSRLALIVTLVFASLALPEKVAHADSDCPPETEPTSVAGAGVICVKVSDPGNPSIPGDDDPPTGDGDGGGCQRNDGMPVPCVTSWGVWVDAHQCWAHPVVVSPNDPAWGDHTSGEVWMCALIDDTVPTVLFWVPPGGPATAPPDPGELAQTAVDQLELAQAEMHAAPAYPSPTIVGVENWLWVPGEQWQTLTKTVAAGATSVTVTAAPERVVWDMGPDQLTCYEPGDEWVEGMGDEAVTDCGYEYEETSGSQPGGVFAVTATIGYQVDWTCLGACSTSSGSLGLVEAASGTGTVQVLQRQTVVMR